MGQQKRDLKSKTRNKDQINTQILQHQDRRRVFLFRFLLLRREGEGFANTFK